MSGEKEIKNIHSLLLKNSYNNRSQKINLFLPQKSMGFGGGLALVLGGLAITGASIWCFSQYDHYDNIGKEGTAVAFILVGTTGVIIGPLMVIGGIMEWTGN